MGQQQSSTVRSVIDVLNQNITNSITTMRDEASVNCVINQNQTVDIGDLTITNCNTIINSTQTATIKSCEINKVGSFQNAQEMISAIKDSIDKTSTSSNKSVQDFMASSFSSQSQVSEFVTKCKTIVENNFTSDTSSVCVLGALINQVGVFHIDKLNITCGEDGTSFNLNISQEAQIEAMAKCITNSVVNLLSKSEEIMAVVEKIQNTQESTQEGVGNIIADFFSAYQTTFIVAGIVLVIAVFIFFSFGGMSIVEKGMDNMGGAGGL